MLDDIKTILLRYPTVSPRTLDPDFVSAVDEMVSVQVRGGYTPLDEIIPIALEYASTENPSPSELAYAQQQLSQAIRQQVSEQITWSGVSDYDRLKAAFTMLEASGVVCREDYSCCSTCGQAEISQEIQDLVEQGQSIAGYVFFHQQNTEQAVDGGGLHFGYGAVEDGDEASAAIGRRLARAMADQGLKVDWNGSINRKVAVELDWKRPLANEVVELVNQLDVNADQAR